MDRNRFAACFPWQLRRSALPVLFVYFVLQLFVLLALSPAPLWAQDREAQAATDTGGAWRPAYAANPAWGPETRQVRETASDDMQGELERRRRTWGIIAGNSLAVALYGKGNWWEDGFNSTFRSQKEGWFGQNTYSGGADKLGHFYMNYAGTRLFSRAFEWAGNTPEQSLEMAGWLMLGTFTAVEVLDGYSKEWRFSREDAVMNVAGIGAAMLLEKNPRLDRLIDLRFLYQPSSGRGFEPFGDYSGQTYLLVAKASGIPVLQTHPLLRYLEFAVGYGSRGYSSRRTTTDEPSRNVYVGISLNLSELLNASVFKSSAEASRTQRVTNTALEFLQVPGTAVFSKTRLRPD
ncbi:hypothetical protein GCM10027343_32070 [Noviherbaspirillum agri]